MLLEREEVFFQGGGEAAMLTIHLEEGTGEAGVSLPPTPQVRLKGCYLCVDADDRPLVRHERRLWTYGAVSFLVAVIDQPIRLRFESNAGTVSDGGCHNGLRISGGQLTVGGTPGKLLASYDEANQRWSSAEAIEPMSHVLILPALPASDVGKNRL
jgi:hypothetical protein